MLEEIWARVLGLKRRKAQELNGALVELEGLIEDERDSVFQSCALSKSWMNGKVLANH